MRFKKISFKNIDGHQLLGRIDFPLIGTPKAYVLFAHCFTCSKNLKSVDHISQAFTQQGMAVLRFDFTGLGQSEGDFSDTNFSSNLSDLKAAYHFLAAYYEPPQIMVGHSLGGAAVLHVSGELEGVKAVATIGAPYTPDHVTHLFDNNMMELEKKGEALVNIGGRSFKIKKQFLDDITDKTRSGAIRDLRKPLLIIHSPQDNIVEIGNAQEIYAEARHPKSFISLDGSDHLMTKNEDAKYAGMMIANWSDRYIHIREREDFGEGKVMTRLGDKGYTTEIIAGSHQMIADEPSSVGGDDYGPTPYEYLLAGLGACTAMTLQIYARHKKIDLKEVEVKLTHDKIDHVDENDGVKSKKKIDYIERMIKLTGDLTDEERKKLIQIADRCPVHITLENTSSIKTLEMD